MKYDLAGLAKRAGLKRKVTVLRPIEMTETFRKDYFRIVMKSVNALSREVHAKVLPRYATVRALTVDMEPEEQELEEALRLVTVALEGVTAQAVVELGDWYTAALRWHEQRWSASIRAGSKVDVRPWIDQLNSLPRVRAMQAQASALIIDVSNQARARVEGTIWRGLTEGTTRRDIQKQVAKDLAVSRRRANLIANDQSTKIASYLTEVRMEEAGLDKYRWKHSGKVNYRPHHKERDGKVFKIGEPAGDQPGWAIHCGCVREPLLELEDEETQGVTQEATQKQTRVRRRKDYREIKTGERLDQKHFEQRGLVGRGTDTIVDKAHGMSRPQKFTVTRVAGIQVLEPVARSYSRLRETQKTLDWIASGDVDPAIVNVNRRIVITGQRNRHDKYWERQYKMPGFRSAATGGDGQIVIYSNGTISRSTFNHETGHNMQLALFGDTRKVPDAYLALHRRALSDPKEEQPARDYGRVAPWEDWATAFETYGDGLQSTHPKRHAIIRNALAGYVPTPRAIVTDFEKAKNGFADVVKRRDQLSATWTELRSALRSERKNDIVELFQSVGELDVKSFTKTELLERLDAAAQQLIGPDAEAFKYSDQVRLERLIDNIKQFFVQRQGAPN